MQRAGGDRPCSKERGWDHGISEQGHAKRRERVGHLEPAGSNRVRIRFHLERFFSEPSGRAVDVKLEALQPEEPSLEGWKQRERDGRGSYYRNQQPSGVC